MADAAVGFLLENLTKLLIHHANLILGAEDEIQTLVNDVRLFEAFLKDSTKKRRKQDAFRGEVVRQIRDVVYEAEDIIDTFVTQKALQKASSARYLTGAFKKPLQLHDIASRVKSIREKVDRIYVRKAELDSNIGDGDTEEPELVPVVKTEKIVGFEDEAATIKSYLKETTEQLGVFTVVGMPGLGKTTLAGKIFHDKDIQYEFPKRIWVYISQDFTRKNVFLNILEGLDMAKDDMHQKTDEQLAKKIKEELNKVGKFLLVMDDVWAPGDWDKIRVALPEGNPAGKVLITSRNEDVAWHANLEKGPHKLRFMTEDESWQLFQYEVFGKLECPLELEDTGKEIVEQCRGLPLAIVVIGGILVKKFAASVDVNAKKRSWLKVSKSVSTYLTMEDSERRMERIIALSYDKLPYHLRACFLYLAMFPEDFAIPVSQLIRMWIAEGFIQSQNNVIFSLEETAESYLDELINRNLLRGDKRRPDGSIKTCRIHDMLRDFCINEARNHKENFLTEIKGHFNRPTVQTYRRICIHSNVSNFISSIDLDAPTRVRSFVCFSKDGHSLPATESKVIPAAFKLLRVLDAEPLKFEKVPSDMYQLLHLRYIVLSFDLEALPPAFGKLWNLETLIAHTTSRTIKISADIWKLSQLRHLKTNVSARLHDHKAAKNPKEGENLQTLGTISPESCTEQVFNRCHKNLKKLSICGRLESLVDSKSVSFVILAKLSSLKKLKLLNEPFPKAPSEVPLTRLPPPNNFPQNLESLTLSDTYLKWSGTDISTLGLLQNLVVLKIKDNAFIGDSWEAEDGGFRCLEFLHIGHTDLRVWEASQHHYPKLRCLELHNCENLQGIPQGLADIKTFRLLDLQHSQGAALSAKQIHDKKQWKGEEFELTTFPPLPRP